MPHSAFLKIQDKVKISGDSTDSKHSGWIDISSFSFNISNSEDTLKEKDEESEGSTVSPISVSKKMDSASSPLAKAACKRSELGTVYVDLCYAKGGQTTFMEYTLKNAKIEEYSVSAGDSYPTEDIVIKYTYIKGTFLENFSWWYDLEEDDAG